ncbi:MAG: TolC family protein [Phycisphaerae bacterium]
MTRAPGTGLTCCLLLATSSLTTLAIGCAPQAGARQVRLTNASLDMEAYRARAPDIRSPLTLEDALDYAARYNIEAWIAAQESKFQRELATQSTLKMLPSLMVGAGSQERSRFDASSSQSLEKRDESLEPSFSSEKRGGTFDISLTWNLLDFGISFLRARQQGNRISIALERERRVVQNLALQVTSTYWRAVAARESAEKAEQIGEEVSVMLADIRKEIADKTISEIDGLKRETSLLERQDELRRFKRDYLKAKTELAKLIGLPPGTPFTLAEVDFDNPIEPLHYDIEELEWEALRNRPELFEKDLEQAISRDEARVALAQMFPSPAMFLQFNYDSNRFLAYENWSTVGIRASWDLLAIPQQIKQRGAVKLQAELIAKRRMAIAVAILTQLHLSLIEYDEGLEQCEFSRTIAQKYGSLLEAVMSQAAEGKSHGGECIEQRMKYLKTRARYLSTYANVMTSNARLLNTIGRTLPCRQDSADEVEAADEPETIVGSLAPEAECD